MAKSKGWEVGGFLVCSQLELNKAGQDNHNDDDLMNSPLRSTGRDMDDRFSLSQATRLQTH